MATLQKIIRLFILCCVSFCAYANISSQDVLSASVLTTPVHCGLTDGSISVKATGGTAPYTYSWSHDSSTASIVTSLGAGTYYCTVTDNAGAAVTVEATLTLPQSNALVLALTSDVSCNGLNNGSAYMMVLSGNVTSYQWSNGATTAHISNLSAGTYYCTYKDESGCEQTDSVVITEPAPYTITHTSVGTLCNEANGSAEITVSGANGSYTYLWSDGTTANTISNLTAGTYTCTVSDLRNCTADVEVVIEAEASQSSILALPLVSNVSCKGKNNGSAYMMLLSGTAESYLWSNGAATPYICDLAPGTYSCTMSDENGCTETDTVVIEEPTELEIVAISNDVLCTGAATGSAEIVASGANGSYTYLWSEGTTTSTISNLTAGTYTCTVSDLRNCTAEVEVIIDEPSTGAISATTLHSDITCYGKNDGSIQVVVSGGTPSYSYSWNNGLPGSSTVNELSAGTYECEIADVNGCTTSVSVEIAEPTTLMVSSNVTHETCSGHDATASLNVSGGHPEYEFMWAHDGANTSSVIGLSAGHYDVVVSDANGCTVTETVSIAANNCTATIAAEEHQNETSLYPNPATVSFMIEAPFELTAVSVTNVDGTLVYAGNETEINTDSFSDGMYFVKAESKYGLIVKKLVVRKN